MTYAAGNGNVSLIDMPFPYSEHLSSPSAIFYHYVFDENNNVSLQLLIDFIVNVKRTPSSPFKTNKIGNARTYGTILPKYWNKITDNVK